MADAACGVITAGADADGTAVPCTGTDVCVVNGTDNTKSFCKAKVTVGTACGVETADNTEAGSPVPCEDGNYCDTTCKACTENCLKCNSATVCTLCDAGFTAVKGICTKCSIAGCIDCSKGAAKCDACDAGYFYSADACTKCSIAGCTDCSKGAAKCDTCDAGYFHGADACTECEDTCATCSAAAAKDCILCAPGHNKVTPVAPATAVCKLVEACHETCTLC